MGKRRALLLSIISAVCLCEPTNGSAQQSSGVTISATLDHARVLSSESVTANYVISNNSNERVTFFSPSDIYAVRLEDGRWDKSPIFGGMSFPIPVYIKPGEQYRSSVTMPSCAVYSDPCRETVAIEVRLQYGTRLVFAYIQSAPLHYEFLPDPTTTYAPRLCPVL